MKKSDIYEIAIKMLGLYLFVTSIGFLREVVSYFIVLNQAKQYSDSFGGFDQTPLLIISIGNFILVTLFAISLTFKTKEIVKIVCNKSDFNEIVQPFGDKKIIYEIGLTLMGFIIIVWTLPEFAFKLKSHIQLVNSNIPSKDSDTDFLIVSAIKIFVGFIAIFFSNPISKYLSKESKDNQSKESGE